MNPIKWPPFPDFKSMTKDLDNMFDEFDSLFSDKSALKFDMDVWEDVEKKMFYVKCQLPGMKRTDIDINVRQDILTITASNKTQKEEKEKIKFYRKEIDETSHQRSIRLPFDIEKEKVEAVYENGFLTISIPRSDIKTSSKIEVK